MSASTTNSEDVPSGPVRALSWLIAGSSAIIGLATSAYGQITTSGSATIEAPAATNVVLDVLSQTNILVSVASPNQAISSVSVPQSLGAAGGGGGADVHLPTIVTPLGGGGGFAMPNGIAMSVGGDLPGPGAAGESGTMLVVVQYN